MQQEQEPKRLKGRKLKTYLCRVRALQQALHICRRDPGTLEQDPRAADRAQLHLDAMAMARALHEGRTFEPCSTYPTLLKQALIAGAAYVPSELARSRLFPLEIVALVKAWIMDLSKTRRNEIEVQAAKAWPKGPGTPRRWPVRSAVARSWKAFQKQHKKRLASGERSTLEDLELAKSEMEKWLQLFNDREFLSEINPSTLHVFRLRHHALCRAIESRRAKTQNQREAA